jgi:hypothetical protein
MPATVVALDGPILLPGPFAATSRAGLLVRMRAAQNRRPLVCFPTCWSTAKPPKHSLLIAVQYPDTACYRLANIHAALRPGRRLIIDLRVAPNCSTAAMAAQRAGDALLAVPMGLLPYRARVQVVVRGALKDAQLAPIGTTNVYLP